MITDDKNHHVQLQTHLRRDNLLILAPHHPTQATQCRNRFHSKDANANRRFDAITKALGPSFAVLHASADKQTNLGPFQYQQYAEVNHQPDDTGEDSEFLHTNVPEYRQYPQAFADGGRKFARSPTPSLTNSSPHNGTTYGYQDLLQMVPINTTNQQTLEYFKPASAAASMAAIKASG